MKKILKRILAFILICSIFTVSLSHEEQKTVHAFAGVDDAFIVNIIIAGVSLVVGAAGVSAAKNSNSSPVDIFKDMFSADTYNTLCHYISEVNVGPADKDLQYLEQQSKYLASAAAKVKSQYKFPVEKLSDGTYKSYDLQGNVIAAPTLPDLLDINGMSERTYYFVDSLDATPFTVNTSGERVLKKEIYDDLTRACSDAQKTIVTVGHAVIDWLKDKSKVGMVDTVAVTGYDYFDKYGADRRAAVQSYFGDSTFFYMEQVSVGFSFNGILLELHTSSGISYALLSAERFETLNNSYSKTGDLSVITNSTAPSLSIKFLNSIMANVEKIYSSNGVGVISLRNESGETILSTNSGG